MTVHSDVVKRLSYWSTDKIMTDILMKAEVFKNFQLQLPTIVSFSCLSILCRIIPIKFRYNDSVKKTNFESRCVQKKTESWEKWSICLAVCHFNPRKGRTSQLKGMCANAMRGPTETVCELKLCACVLINDCR